MNYSILIPALLLLTLPACGTEKDLADTVDPTATTSTTEPEVTGSDAATAIEATAAETTATTGAPEPVCPNSDNFGCTVPPGCEGFPCGELDDRFDADGCPRPSCSDSEPCPEGYVCYDTGDWGLCNASSASCDELEGECVCGQTADCQDVAYCVPAEVGPPADCFAIPDPDACNAAGCDGGWSIKPVAIVDDTCVCGEAQPACLWFPNGASGWSLVSPYYHLGTLEVVMMPEAWSSPPHGWADCEGDPNAPAACACTLC